MTLGEIQLEPNGQLWAGVPAFLAVLLVLDVVVARPNWAITAAIGRFWRWATAGGLIALAIAILWFRPGVPVTPTWWYPAWSVALFWAVVAREASIRPARRGRSGIRAAVHIGCGIGALISLLALARSRSPDATSLLIWFLAVVVVVTLVTCWRAYRTAGTLERAPQRWPVALRFSAVIVLAIVLLNPVTRHKRVRYERARLLVLLDDSKSMAVRDVIPSDGAEPISRAAALNPALTGCGYEFDRIARELDVLSYRFSDRLTAADGLSIRARGEYTALGDAIQQAYEAALQHGRPVAGVIVLTDGANNMAALAEPTSAATALAAGRVPLWTVGIGSETPRGQTCTIIPRSLHMPRRAIATNRVPVEAEFSFVGLQAEPVRVELLFDDQLVSRQRVRCDKAQETRRVRFDFMPQVGGLHKVTVRATPERFRPTNAVSSMSQYLHVTDEFIRVLYVEGKPRYESTFVFRALAGAEHIRLRKALLTGPADDRVRTVVDGPAGDWQWYHVIILGDMMPGDLTDYHMRLIRHHVGTNGCGLAILGNRGWIGRGGLAGTPLAELLPVASVPEWMDRAVPVVPARAGLEHGICRIAGSDVDLARVWRDLPAMRGACRFANPKPAARVLAAGDRGNPMIVAHRYGAGRVLALAFDSTWQWCMLRDDGAERHRRFWRQIVLWLANRKPAVWIAAERPRYQLPLLQAGRQRVEIQAGIDLAVGAQPLEAVEIDARLVRPDGEATPLTMTRDGDHYATMADPAIDGTYKLELTVKSGGSQIGQAAGMFVVESPDLEAIHQLADLELLRQMARRTEPAGGEFITLDGLGKLLQRIGTHDYRRRHEETLTSELAHDGRWRLWMLFCGLLLAEWIVRKRRGLV